MKKKVFLLFLIAFIFCVFPEIKAFAQEETAGGPVAAPSGPSEADIEAAEAEGNAQAGQAAQGRASEESAQMRAQFESEFGAPPEAFQKHEPAKPEFEQPQRVPDEAKKYLTDAELIPIYCAMTKWKTGQFFGAMNALKENMLPAMQKAKEALGIDSPLPNIDKMIEEGNAKINTVCSAKTLTEAEDTVMTFAAMGQDLDQNEIGKFMAEFENKMKAKGDEIKQKIEAFVNPIVEEEKAKIQPEIEADAKAYVKSNIKFDHQPSAEEMAAVQAQVENYLKPKIEQKKQEISQKIQARVNELKDKEVGEIEKIGKLFEGIDQKINDASKRGLEEYDRYKKEAFSLRKEAVFKILDKNLEEGLKKLDESEKDIETARKDDPSIRSAGEIRSAIAQDRKDLEAKLDAAMEAGDETAFQQALSDFKTKWETARAEGEKAAEQSMTKACNMATAEFGKAKGQMESNLAKIKNLTGKCDGKVTDECLAINKFSDRFNTLTAKMTDLRSAMNMAEEMCADTNKADKQSLIALMRKIQSDGEDLKIYGEALEAEKSNAIADTAEKVCAKILPELSAAKTEISGNDLALIKNNLAKCAGKTTEECSAINKLAPKVKELSAKIDTFLGKVASAENFCKAPTESDLEKIGTVLNTLADDGEKLRILGKELQAEQAEKASKKALCKAVIPQLEIGKSQISAGFAKVSKVQTDCAGKTDDICKSVLALKPKMDEVTTKMTDTQAMLKSAGEQCAAAGTEVPDDKFIELLNGAKINSELVKKLVAELEAEQEKAKKVILRGTWIEAENETKTSLLPKTADWHSREETNPSWRPPYYGTGVWYLSRGGESLQYTFTHKVSTTYNIWVRDYVDNFQPAGVRRVTYYINGIKVVTAPEVTLSKDKIDSAKGAFGWHKIASNYKINGGSNTLKVEKESTTSGAAILDAFYITDGTETPPEK